MPTYEYRCANGHLFERFYKSMSAAQAELPCPECESTGKRLMSAGAGLLFKGAGFYLTDYGKNAHRGSRSESGKAEGGKVEGGKAEGGKAEGGKAEGGKAEGGKTAGPTTPAEPVKKSADRKPAPKKAE